MGKAKRLLSPHHIKIQKKLLTKNFLLPVLVISVCQLQVPDYANVYQVYF